MDDVSQPLRLLRRDGHWTLEVTRLVPIDRHVLRPECRRVSGAESVVRHLKERCVPAQVRAALDLIVGEDDGTSRAFELEGEHWVQLPDEPDGSAGATQAALVAMVSELRVELLTLRAMYEALRSRLAQVERRALHHAPGDPPRLPRGPARREPSLRPGPKHVVAATMAAATYGELPLAEARTQTARPAVAEPEVAQVPDAVPSAEPAPATPARKALVLPTQLDIATCLKQLLGADAELRPEKGALPSDLENFYVSRVVDAEDQEVAAFLLDLRAGAELGGTLLGLPASTIEEQAGTEPSADLLDAMNEVTNNLGGFLNRANPDVRTRVTPLKKLGETEPGWLPQNVARIGCSTKGGGKLWLATR
jgi:hypothetical protein